MRQRKKKLEPLDTHIAAQKPVALPDVVEAPRFNVFQSTRISPQYQISAEGKREGSNDHKQIKSRHA
jgi:hypothetical protein